MDNSSNSLKLSVQQPSDLNQQIEMKQIVIEDEHEVIHAEAGKKQKPVNQVKLSLNYFDEKTAKNNKIRTTKYKWYSFIFIFLYEELQRATNIFQLFSACFNLIPNAGVVTPFTAFSALIFVIGIAAIREILEDISRAKFDKDSNRELYEVIRNGKKETVFAINIKEGDVLIIKDNQEVPIDGVVIYQSDSTKQAHVTTSSIDGESNLKNKAQVFSEYIGSDLNDVTDQFLSLKARVVTSQANSVMNDLSGKIALTSRVRKNNLMDMSLDNGSRIELLKGSFGSKSFSDYVSKAGVVSNENTTEITQIAYFNHVNCVLRGMRLINTKFALVGVIFVSNDTKIMQNQLKIRGKTSKLEQRTNQMIAIMSVFCLILTFSFTGASLSVASTYYGYVAYANETRNKGMQLLQKFVQNLLISVYFLPVSMYITLEFSRFFQACVINVDRGLRRCDVLHWMRENSGEKLAESPFEAENQVQYEALVKNSIAVENLNETDIIFSDKTGTLTKNQITLKAYVSPTLKLEQAQADSDIDVTTLFALALCNTVVPVAESGTLSYEGESPDEIAFVKAAAQSGLRLIQRDPKEVFYEFSFMYEKQLVSLKLKYKVLAVIPFSSDRKKMSIILKEIGTAIDADLGIQSDHIRNGIFFGTPLAIAEQGRPFVLTKGADSFVLPLMDVSQRENEKNLLQRYIDDFSRVGLRTLVFGSKILDDEKYLTYWLTQFESISLKDEHEEVYVEHTAQMESALSYLCVSAAEDELQDDLKYTLNSLVAAKIKLWMCSGDKTLTAVNIAKSSGLSEFGNHFSFFTHDQHMKIKNEQNGLPEQAVLLKMLQSARDYEWSVLNYEEEELYLEEQKTIEELNVKPKTLWNSFVELFKVQKEHYFAIKQTIVLDSDVLRLFIKHKLLHQFFFTAYNAQSVVCCRLSPQEKAELVLTCRKLYPHAVTLAIGDGANDKFMIRAAHIGVGIAGKEGLHACNSSDIALPAFKHLQRMIFMHGRTSHYRNAYLVDYCIWKTSMVAIINLMYSFWSAISGQVITETFILSFYNTFITFFPVFWYALSEKDAYEDMCQRYPQTISEVHSKYLPNFRSVWVNILYGLYCSVIIYFVEYYVFEGGLMAAGGSELDLYGFETILALSLTYVAVVRVYVETKVFNWSVFCVLVLSLLILYLCVIVGNWFTGFGLGLQGQIFYIFTNFSYTMTIVLTVVLAMLPLLVFENAKRYWAPSISDLMLPSSSCACHDEFAIASTKDQEIEQIIAIVDGKREAVV